MNTSESIKVSAYMAVSLDGFIARPDGDISWLHENESPDDQEDFGYQTFFDSVDVMVMGRGTFEKVLEFDAWPYAEKPVKVLSRGISGIPDSLRETVTVEIAAPGQLVEQLTQAGYRHVYLDGGRVVQSFLRARLVDEITLTWIPRLIGSGISLFGDLENDVHLRHLTTRSWSNGFVQTTYQVLR